MVLRSLCYIAEYPHTRQVMSYCINPSFPLTSLPSLSLPLHPSLSRSLHPLPLHLFLPPSLPVSVGLLRAVDFPIISCVYSLYICARVQMTWN